MIITGVEDYNFGTYTVGTGDQVQSRFVCIGKDAGNRNWSGIFNGSGTGGAFTLNDGSGNTVPYTVRRRPNPAFLAGVSNNSNQADNSVPLDRGGVDNQEFEITVPGASLDGAPAGTYTGTISFQISPP